MYPAKPDITENVGGFTMGVNEAKAAIQNNKTALGIEFGSTRIKAVLVNDKMSRLHQEAMIGKINT